MVFIKDFIKSLLYLLLLDNNMYNGIQLNCKENK